MKNIFKFSAVAVAALSLAACQDLNKYPVFDAADSFVAFEKEAVTVDENKGTVTLVIKQASYEPVATSVAYTVTDITAEKGKNYKDTNIDGVVTFDGESRQAAITFEIYDGDGEGKFGFTGDVQFKVEIASVDGMKIGAENTCTVTIADLDHPLSELFGEWTATGTDYKNNPVSYTVKIGKDATSIKTVLISNLGAKYNSDISPISATVQKDDTGKITGIVIPAGQSWAYGSYKMYIAAIDADGEYISTKADLSMTYSDGTLTWVGAEGYPGFFLAAEASDGIYLGMYLISGPVLTKN